MSNRGKCRSCNADIVWLKTSQGKNIPIDASSYKDEADTVFDPKKHVSHFSTCPDAAKFRKKK